MAKEFQVRDLRRKEKFVIDDDYLNGWAKHLDPYTTVVYLSLCRHVDKEQKCFPSHELIAEEHGIGRRTVICRMKVLEEHNLVRKKEQKRSESSGKYLHNTYYLLDKSEWKKPTEYRQGHTVHRMSSQAPTECTGGHTKDTHIKDTHTISKDIAEQGYGKPEINRILESLRKHMGHSLLDGSEKENRRYAQLCLQKFKTLDSCLHLIDMAFRDDFWKQQITSTKDLYYKAAKIYASSKGGKRGIDAQAILER